MSKIKFPSYIKEGGGRMDDAVFYNKKGEIVHDDLQGEGV